MRKEWMEPVIEVQEFVANEYVAACESGMVYKFTCDAPGGPLYYYPEGDGKINGEYTGHGSAELLGLFYHPCDAKHEASVKVTFTMDLLITIITDGRILTKESLYGAVQTIITDMQPSN